MVLRPLFLAGLVGLSQAWAAPPAKVEPEEAVPASEADPFFLPAEAKAYVRTVTVLVPSASQKLQALLRALFRSREHGGMGLTYDNSRTRTVAEVWQDGKANCLSLTAFFVMSCRYLGITANFAEAVNTNHWRKVGSIVHYERHVVALTPLPPLTDMVADFMPELRKRFGTYMVAILPEPRFRALYYSNLAVEALTSGDLEAARAKVQLSLDADPKCSVGWNVLGVVNVAQGDLTKAEQAYRKAMAMDAKDGAPIGNLETLLRDTGRDEEAAKYRLLGETVRKKDPYFHAYLAEEALNGGNLVEADTRIHAALKLVPREPDFLLLKARVKLAEGDVDAALKEIGLAKKWSDPSERERWDGKLALIEGMKASKGKL